MSKDDQFTALGEASGTPVGFQTDSTDIARGAEITGFQAGIKGECSGLNGAGVSGLGGRQGGTGVVGAGGGIRNEAEASGGIGVEGIGGLNLDFDSNNIPPGIGVLAKGGRLLISRDTKRQPHGAGVVALAGWPSGEAVPPLTDTGGVGVFGHGAD